MGLEVLEKSYTHVIAPWYSGRRKTTAPRVLLTIHHFIPILWQIRRRVRFSSRSCNAEDPFHISLNAYGLLWPKFACKMQILNLNLAEKAKLRARCSPFFPGFEASLINDNPLHKTNLWQKLSLTSLCIVKLLRLRWSSKRESTIQFYTAARLCHSLSLVMSTSSVTFHTISFVYAVFAALLAALLEIAALEQAPSAAPCHLVWRYLSFCLSLILPPGSSFHLINIDDLDFLRRPFVLLNCYSFLLRNVSRSILVEDVLLGRKALHSSETTFDLQWKTPFELLSICLTLSHLSIAL